jgi:hypothetical protein
MLQYFYRVTPGNLSKLEYPNLTRAIILLPCIPIKHVLFFLAAKSINTGAVDVTRKKKVSD